MESIIPIFNRVYFPYYVSLPECNWGILLKWPMLFGDYHPLASYAKGGTLRGKKHVAR